ncbi:LPXTG-motif cell wall-anchored protein [Nocardiopsis mwathae]|uniref:LPXTG-motif cell wall-anchored protein n=1 Tax=Nocardiopsis mwathae TaxID=1472723 RepID=A0A7W9YK60_9ACTN|nr:hypothetical protein [Nocardiopsis mwathae]MBB6173668.1 LPXTG-motif cell wall-anchored protein [Nocardiopsis mwathae]
MTRTAAGFAVAAFVGLGGVFSAPLAVADDAAAKSEAKAEENGAESTPKENEGGSAEKSQDGASSEESGGESSDEKDKGEKKDEKQEGDAKDESSAPAEETPENIDSEPRTLDSDIEGELDLDFDFEDDYLAQKTYAYTCKAGDQTENAQIVWTLAHSGDAKTGDPYVWAGGIDDAPFYLVEEPIQKATISSVFDLGGPAAPQKSLTSTAVATGPADDINDIPADKWNFDGTSGTFTPLKPGKLTFTPGTITIKIEQASGTATTTCSPSKPAELASVQITGDDLSGQKGQDGDGDGQKGSDTDPAKKAEGAGTDDDPTKNAETAGSNLPVTGAALAGLVAAGAAALGGGGAAMYFARKKKAAAEAPGDEA